MNDKEKQAVIDDIKKITEPIFKLYGVKKAYVFGSYARGDYNEHSDIDIIILAPEIKSLMTIGGLLEDLKSALNKEVDLLEEECFKYTTDIDKKFIKNVKKERIAIYG